MGTGSSLGAEALGKAFRKYVLAKSFFTSMFKTELSGKQHRRVEVGDLVLPSTAPPPSAPAWPPCMDLQGMSRALLLPVSRPAAWGHQTDHGHPEDTEERP